MKSILTALCVVLGMTITFGQSAKGKQKRTPEQRAEQQTAALDKQVQLTAEQRPQVYQFNLAAAQKNDAVRKNGSLTQDQAKEQIKANNKERREAVSKVLTEEQKKKLKASKKGNKEESDEE